MKQKNLVLMVVAVGCGLVAAFLTSQMSAKPQQVEKVKIIVAAKDLPVGTQLTKDELKNMVKTREVSKDSVPTSIVETEEELLEKRLTRTIRADEPFNKADVTRGGIVSIPPGMSMVALPIGLPQAVAGFVGPGSRVDVLGSVQLQNKVTVLPILVNMLVLAVDSNVALPNQGAYQNLSTVSFAVDRKQALLIKLAQARHCDLSLMLRNPDEKVTENDKLYDIDKVVKLLQDQRTRNNIVDPDEDSKKDDVSPLTAPIPAPTAKSELVKVPAAAEEIPAGTEITNDLIAEKFKLIELPKEVAEEAVADLAPLAGKGEVLRHGLGKGQWVTKSLVGRADLKAPPRDEFNLPKLEPQKVETVKVHAAAEDIPAGTKITTDVIAKKFKQIDLPKDLAEEAIADLNQVVGKEAVFPNGLGKGQWVTKSLVGKAPPPPAKVVPVARRTHDVALHTANGTRHYRYEEVAPGEWQLIGEVRPGARRPAAQRQPQPQAAPPAADAAEKVD